MGFKPYQVAELRTRFRMSTAKFAKKLRVSPRAVQYWETGEKVPTPPVQVLMRLLDAGIDYDQLLKDHFPNVTEKGEQS